MLVESDFLAGVGCSFPKDSAPRVKDVMRTTRRADLNLSAAEEVPGLEDHLVQNGRYDQFGAYDMTLVDVMPSEDGQSAAYLLRAEYRDQRHTQDFSVVGVFSAETDDAVEQKHWVAHRLPKKATAMRIPGKRYHKTSKTARFENPDAAYTSIGDYDAENGVVLLDGPAGAKLVDVLQKEE